MALYLRETAAGECPWDVLSSWLVEKKSEGKEIFRDHQAKRWGFAIAGWNEGECIPAYYLHSIFQGLHKASPKDWFLFEDPVFPQDPFQYSDLRSTLSLVDALKKKLNQERIGLVYWMSPVLEDMGLPETLLRQSFCRLHKSAVLVAASA